MTAVLFDLDGTLLDTLTDLTESVNATMTHFGCPTHSPQAVRAMVGNGVRNLVASALPGRADDPDVDTALAFYRAHYDAHYQDHTGPYPGVIRAMEEIAALCPVGIVSNKHDLAVKGLAKTHFAGVYALGERAGIPRKPAPDMLFRALEDLGCSRCIYIGDSEVDILTAQNAGVRCLSVTWGFRDEKQLLEAGAAELWDTPATIGEKIEEMIHGK